MRKMLNLVDVASAACASHLTTVTAARETQKQRLASAERDARQRVEAWRPTDVSQQIREDLRRREVHLLSQTTTPLDIDFDEAYRRWQRLAPAAKRLADLYLRELDAFGAKLIRRKKSAPVVPPNLWGLLDELAVLFARRDELAEAYVASAIRLVRDDESALTADIAQRYAELQQRVARAAEDIARTAAALGRNALPWSANALRDVEAAGRVLRLGQLQVSLPGSAGAFDVPVVLDFPLTQLVAFEHRAEQRQLTLDMARSAVLRALDQLPGGKLHCSFIDPIALGQSVAEFRHLADFDERLVDVKTWTAEGDIERKLGDLASHLEIVISSYLRGQFDTIEEYNRQAGEVAEPYRLLVVLDYPAGFTETSAGQLLSLVENGPRCGVMTLLTYDPTAEQPRGVALERLLQGSASIEWRAGSGSQPRLRLPEPVGVIEHDFLPDIAPPISFSVDGRAESDAAELLLAVGRSCAVESSDRVSLSRIRQLLAAGSQRAEPSAGAAFNETDPSSWWSETTSHRAEGVLGRAGARELARLSFSSTDVAGGAIVVGLPRSGKSTSLHAVILTMCMAYPPSELELFLVDSKVGVEFKVFDTLPHARMVSIRSEREFSVAVLQSLDAEIQRRGDAMKRRGGGATNLTEFRTRTGELMPRIVLVMDEFHEVFEEDDALGHAAFQAFSNIARQGPFAGVHLIVSSQTLSSMPAMDRNTLQLLPMRVAFMCNEFDADIVMGDRNQAAKALHEQGRGIFNPARGEPSRNVPFRGLLIDSHERALLVASLRQKADELGLPRRPIVFDGDECAERPSAAPEARRDAVQIPIGEAFDLSGAVVISLVRQRGANVLLVGTDDDEVESDPAVLGVLHSVLIGARDQGVDVSMLCIGAPPRRDDAPPLQAVARDLSCDLVRGRQWAQVVQVHADEVDRRQQAEEFSAPPKLLVISGLQFADLEPPERGFGAYGDEDVMRSPADALACVLRDGPDVGVHTVVWVDQYIQFERRLGRDAASEFQHRIFTSTTNQQDISLLSEDHRGLTLRTGQLALVDVTRLKRRRVRGYEPITSNEEGTTDGE